MTNPALWAAVAGCITAAASLIAALRARAKAADAHAIALGHALDRTRHPAPPPGARRPSSPGGVR